MPDAIEISPDAPVTVTLPRRVMKRVLDSVREHAYKLTRRDDQVDMSRLRRASALDAQPDPGFDAAPTIGAV